MKNSTGVSATKTFPTGQRKGWSHTARKTIAILFWGFLIAKLFFLDVDAYLISEYLPSLSFVLPWRVGLYPLLFLGVPIAIFGPKRGLFFILRIVFFPVSLLFWQSLLFCFRHPSPVLVVVLSQYGSFKPDTVRRTAFWVIVVPVCVLVVLATSQPVMLVIAMVFLGAYLCSHYWEYVRRAYLQDGLLSCVLDKLRRGNTRLSKGTFLKSQPGKKSSTAEKKKERETDYFALYMLTRLCETGADWVKKKGIGRKADLVTVLFLLGSIFLTVVVFALEYFSLHKIDPVSFSTTQPINFWSFMELSFNTLMTASLTDIMPESPAAKSLCHLELLATLVLFFIVIPILFNLRRDRYQNASDAIVKELMDCATKIAELGQRHFKITIEEIERQLCDSQLATVNALRALQGLPQLAAPKEGNGGSDSPPAQARSDDKNGQTG